MRRLLPSLLAVLLLTACNLDTEPEFDTVAALFAEAGGSAWCGDDLQVTLPPFVGNCGDAATDSRVVLGVGGGGPELRDSIGGARDNLEEDGQFLLVPTDPDREYGWQVRSRDRSLLEEAQDALGGVILDSIADVDEWLGDEAPSAVDAAEGLGGAPDRI